jgi:hypothetical protein
LLNSCNQYGCQLGHFNIKLPILPHPGYRWIAERSLRFDPKTEIEDNSILAGYWQSELYFNHIEKEIREELTLKGPLSYAAQEASTLIRDTPNSVAVHVRHGDITYEPTNCSKVITFSYSLTSHNVISHCLTLECNAYRMRICI